MILVCASPDDIVAQTLCGQLDTCGYPYHLLDLDTYPYSYQVSWRWQGTTVSGYIAATDWRLDVGEISAVYIRYPLSPQRQRLPDLDAAASRAAHAAADIGLNALLAHLPGMVVNHAVDELSNYSKPYQSLLISQSGLRVPPTLVTSDPAAARRFYDEHGGAIICKSLSWVRSIVRMVGEEQLARLPLLRSCPVQFQAYIAGEDVRVHTVGDQLFATRIRSSGVDYRYAVQEGLATTMQPTSVPPHIAAACFALARRLHLPLAGIDLRETAAGEWYCFEVNPSPAFSYYQQRTGQAISLALAELLQHGPSAHPHTVGEKEVATNQTSD